ERYRRSLALVTQRARVVGVHGRVAAANADAVDAIAPWAIERTRHSARPHRIKVHRLAQLAQHEPPRRLHAQQHRDALVGLALGADKHAGEEVGEPRMPQFGHVLIAVVAHHLEYWVV